MKQKRICPLCNKEYYEHPAISRKDNATEICPPCGIEEAFADFYDYIEKVSKKED